MAKLDETIVVVFHTLFGAFLGFLVFMFGIGGLLSLFTEPSEATWLGPVGLFVCPGVGGLLGWFAYRHRHREFGGPGILAQDTAGGVLLVKRLMVVAACLVGLYFLWQLAKSLR
jgi:hypothetical protein